MEILDVPWAALPEPMRAQLAGASDAFWRFLPQGLAALSFLIVAALLIWAVRRVMPRALRRAHLRRSLVDVFVMLATVGLWLAAALIAVTIAFPTVTPGRAVAALGIGGLAIGFAFKDIFENFLAGILLLLREPFTIGDFVEAEGIDGRVEVITVRDTHVRQTDGQLVVAPNAIFFSNPVTVRTSNDLRRTTVICGVAYGEDVDEAREVIRKAVAAVESVDTDVHDVEIFAQAFGESSIDFEVTWWTGSRPIDIRSSRDKVVAAVKRALDEAGIEIPFPYRTLTFKEALPLRRNRDDEDADAGDDG
ncbi:MAG: mechanosensitive ion channel family protein [Paracoccaceae bacterium]